MAANRSVGSRRIFPAMFKLTVLDAYRNDPECKGNQRATARKFNIHRRQIQKWLQCERTLRANVEDALRYDQQHLAPSTNKAPPSVSMVAAVSPLLGQAPSRVFKHDARTLKLVAQKLYPSSYPGAVVLEDNPKGETPSYSVPNDDPIRAHHRKLSIDDTVSSLILKDGNEPSSAAALVQKYTDEPRGLPRPTPLFNRPPALCEPFNLVMARARSATPPVPTPPAAPRPASTGSLASSPLPARVAEIVADSKTSAFSPKRKWLQDSLLEQTAPLPLIMPKKRERSPQPPPAKRPCPDFSVERLCGSPAAAKETPIKTEPLLTPMPFFPPPPLMLPHRVIPELQSLHFKPEPCVKQEALTDDDDDEPIDVLTTSPTETKHFDYCSAKRRNFSVQFKLNVLDAFYHDKDCNKNQRATARKFNINRRQVQKWLSVEDELRGSDGEYDGCAGCPRHCALTFNCQNCPLGDYECAMPRPTLPPAAYNLPWFNPYDVAAIY